MRRPAGTAALILLLLAATPDTGHCQPKCAFTHYSVEDGLSEGVALTMHQDREGLMWFGTFDGLNRFDGYSFKVYKSGFNSSYGLTNNRVDRITEDDLGHLWIMNNDGEVYRMNTRTEEFINFNEISADSFHSGIFNKGRICIVIRSWEQNPVFFFAACHCYSPKSKIKSLRCSVCNDKIIRTGLGISLGQCFS